MKSFSLLTIAFLGVVAGQTITVQSPDSQSSYHAGDEVNVKWAYEGSGEYFSILLLKAGEEVADLCQAEENGLCYDLTQDQNVLLPSTGLESGDDYTVTVTDSSSESTAESDEFTVLSSADVNLEIIQPSGETSLSAGQELDVSWLYVGTNDMFDIYLRQDGVRVTENLCGDETGGSCQTSEGQATVTLPTGLDAARDYSLLVVDKADDDAYGLSENLAIGISVAGTDGDSDESVGTVVGIVVGACAGAVCLLAILVVLCRSRNRRRKHDEKMTTRDIMNKRRPAPSVNLSVEGMQQPASPSGGICVRLGCCLPKSWKVMGVSDSSRTKDDTTRNSPGDQIV